MTEVLKLFRSFYRRARPVDALLADVELGEKRDAWVGKLSGGQRQRLAIACALVGEPEILFLDEPTTGLDPQSRRQLWELVLRFRGAGGTVVLTTHYMEEAERLCDRVAIIDHGAHHQGGIAGGADSRRWAPRTSSSSTSKAASRSSRPTCWRCRPSRARVCPRTGCTR